MTTIISARQRSATRQQNEQQDGREPPEDRKPAPVFRDWAAI